MADLEARMVADTMWLRAEFFRIVPALTAREIATLAGIVGESAFQSVEGWRIDGPIFSVKRSTEDFYPAFQFGPDLRPADRRQDSRDTPATQIAERLGLRAVVCR